MQPTNTQPTTPASNTPFNNGAPLTTQQIQNMRQQMNISPTAGNSSAGSSNVSSQWAKYDGAQQQQSTQDTVQQPQPQIDPVTGQPLASTPGPVVQNPSNDIQSARSNVNDAISGTGNYAGQNPVQRGLGAASEAATGLTNTVADVVPFGKNALNAVSTDGGGLIKDAGSVLGTLGIMLGSTKAAQDIVNRFPGLSDALINAGQSAATAGTQAGNISGTILGAEGVAAAGDKALSAATDATTKVSSATSDAASSAKEAVQNKATSMAENSAKSEWEKPTTKPQAAYSKAKDIYTNAAKGGNDISQRLVDNGIKISDNIESNATGKRVFSTSDTADKMRADTGKMSSDMLKPSLEKADAAGAPKTSIDDVTSKAKDNVNNNSKLTQETKDSINKNIDRSSSALKKQYPNGMSLSDLHGEKITRDLNSKYNPLGDTSQTTEALKNKALADSMRTTLEAKAPPEVPVKQFNAELQKQYQTADYLDSLDGKPVPTGIATRLTRAGARGIGAVIGSHLGIGGAFGGYSLGGILESTVENMPTSIRDSFLNNLKTTNPEAFSKVSTYLTSKQ